VEKMEKESGEKKRKTKTGESERERPESACNSYPALGYT